MAWIRLDDDYMDHPKILALSDGAFRLWHEGIRYCRKLLTDGLVPTAALKLFRYASGKRLDELTTSHCGSDPLWHKVDAGYLVHDYLIWNRSKEHEVQDRAGAKDRAARFRSKRVTNAPAHTPLRTDLVLNMEEGSSLKEETSENEEPIKPAQMQRRGEFDTAQTPELADRARELVENYATWFYRLRKGARYKQRPNIDYFRALDVVGTWDDDARIEKLATLVLTTDDEWISSTDRGFGVFAAKASWADDRLRKWELEHGILQESEAVQ